MGEFEGKRELNYEWFIEKCVDTIFVNNAGGSSLGVHDKLVHGGCDA